MGEKHTELVHRATRFLRREGCTVVYAEAGGWNMKEQPDAIGFTKRGASHVVEAKVSRADFLADSNKGYRDRSVGMGMYRWYMVPDGLVRPSEIPDDHGLVYVKGRSTLVQRQPKRRETFDAEAERLWMLKALRRQQLGIPFDSKTSRFETSRELSQRLNRGLPLDERFAFPCFSPSPCECAECDEENRPTEIESA